MAILKRFPFVFVLLFLVGIGFSIYGKSLGNRLCNWDDWVYENDPAVQNFDVINMFRMTLLGNYYPVTLMSLGLDAQVAGISPVPYHLTNLLLHIGNAIAVVYLFLQFFDGSWVLAFLGGLLFLSHPVQADTVPWLSARNQILCALFSLCAIQAYRRMILTGFSWKKYFWVLALVLLALLSKSLAVVLPFLFLALIWIEKRNDSRRLFLVTLPLLLVSFGMSIVTVKLFRYRAFNPAEIFHVSFFERLLWAAKGVVFYVSHLLCPTHLSAYYDINLVQISAVNWIPFVAFCLVLLVYFRIPALRSKGSSFGLMLFLITLAPILKVIPFGEFSVFHDRYLYLPIAGMLLFLGGILQKLVQQKRAYAVSAVGMCVLLGAFQSVYAFERSLVWAESETLWKDILDKYPETAMAHNNLGRAYMLNNRWKSAEAEFHEAIKARPIFDLPYYNLGLVEDHLGNQELAVEYYKKTIEVNPWFNEAYNNVGNYYSNQGDHETALKYFLLGIRKGIEEGLPLKSQKEELYYNAGFSHAALGNNDQARILLQYALAINPDLTVARVLLDRLNSLPRSAH